MLKDAGAHDVRIGVHVRPTGAREARNEFDVLATHMNQLLFIECKTLKHQDASDSDIAYKVDSLSKAARGLFGETWLISAREPTANLRERAERAWIRLIGAAELPRLKEAVRDWLAP